MKIKKGNKTYPFITGDDVIITKGVDNPGLTTVDDALDEHKKEIDKLKSNLKYVYSYGGVGGKGSGGSGSGSQESTAKLFITLGGQLIQDGPDHIITLNGPGTYVIEGNVSNPNGRAYSVKVDTEERYNSSQPITLSTTSTNRYSFTKTINLQRNGKIKVEFFNIDNGDERMGYILQNYIVTPHTFDVKFKYQYRDGYNNLKYGDFIQPYEYFIGDSTHLNPVVDVSYKISLSNVSNISLTYNVGDTDVVTEETDEVISGQGIKQYNTTDISDDQNHLKIPLLKLMKDNKPFIDERNTGVFNVSVSLKYTMSNGEENEDSRKFQVSLIPNYLYINVRNPQNLLYDSLEDLNQDKVAGIPKRNLNIGAYTSFYCKVYEKEMVGTPCQYKVKFNAYDEYTGSDPDHDPFDDEPSRTDSMDGVNEQAETPIPFSVAFNTPGVKKLVFSTLGAKTTDHSDERPIIKYIYVNEFNSEDFINWYSDVDQRNFYFRANHGYSDNFPHFSEGTSSLNPVEMSESGSSITISNPEWKNPGGRNTTILSLGVQYSAVNKSDALILETYEARGDTFMTTPNIELRADSIFSQKIHIPSEKSFDKSVNTKYHLIQIVRHKIDFIEARQENKYATYLYIDGRLEACDTGSNTQLFIGKIVLNNVNIVYNLIELQYVQLNIPKTFANNYNFESADPTIDEMIYQYYLAYKDIMGVGTVTDAERTIFENRSSIRFDGTNVIVNSGFLDGFVRSMPIPTMMMEYQEDPNSETLEEDRQLFTENLFKGYQDADTETFKEPFINLYWSTGAKENSVNTGLLNIPRPVITDTETGFTYDGDWKVKLQGTSTMRNRIKNFSLLVNTRPTHDDKMKILMSPNYDPTNPKSFLPEAEWTLKADIADSAHANNTSIGKFVNDVCTPFINNNGQQALRSDIKPFIKNTLEGFPFFMFFKIGDKVYYLGVYNFNLGRKSVYNLGYCTKEDTEYMVDHITHFEDSNIPFLLSVSEGIAVPDLAIGEIQENNPEFDFHQCDRSVLFSQTESNSGRASMFGPPSKLTGNVTNTQGTLARFVKSVAKAGAYCFSRLGKKPVPSEDDGKCVFKYKLMTDIDPVTGLTKEYECVPDINRQFYYNSDSVKVWYDADDPNLTNTTPDPEMSFDAIKNNSDFLLKCIHYANIDGVRYQDPYVLEFSSVSEYYTICMAFGLVDSILKNMNIKSWDGNRCFVAFYDMDCAFGENNAGKEVISYLAATDYWHSNMRADGTVEQAVVHYDYWNDQDSTGFDAPSSYLFAIAKYAQSILNNTGEESKRIVLQNYPQYFWAKLRQKGGKLETADSFIENYFSSGIGKIPAYLASLNYQVKYLYEGEYFDANNEVKTGYLANAVAFNGTRLEKVREWLNRRFHFLDLIFNIQGIEKEIGGGCLIPTCNDSDIKQQLSKNPDVSILTDIFSLGENCRALVSTYNTPVRIKAPENTPCILTWGSNNNEIYILGAKPDSVPNYNIISVNVRAAQACRLLGSKEFTDMDCVEPLLTDGQVINSNNLESVRYGGFDMNKDDDFRLTITSTSVKEIDFGVPVFTGVLYIDNGIGSDNTLNGQALHTLKVAGSGITGTWNNLKNLRVLDISSVNNPNGTISVSQCPLDANATGFRISGTEEKPTTLQTLNLAGISGNIRITNTKIEKLSMSVTDGKEGVFFINGDKKLNELTLTGFKSIEIRECPNLHKLVIEDPDNICESIIIDIPDYVPENGEQTFDLEGFNNTYGSVDYPGVFDFSKYGSLKTLSLSGSKAKVIKIPNRLVSIETFKNNELLEFIDTVGENSVIEITGPETFNNCPRYGMRQSWWSGGNDGADIRTLTSGSNVGVLTRMCISPFCTSLANTFARKDASEIYDSLYISNPYTNIWGQQVKNVKISMSDVKMFLDNYVGAQPIDEAWIDDNNIIHDTLFGSKVFGDPEDHRGNILSLNSCFCRQKSVVYTGSSSANLPDLSYYQNLTDISGMYLTTGVKCLSAKLLSFDRSLNDNNHPIIAMYDFVGTGTIKILDDAFKNISYRIAEFYNVQFSVYDSETGNNLLYLENNGEYLDILSILWPKRKDGSDQEYVTEDVDFNYANVYEPFTRLEVFRSFNIDANQHVDYRRLFKLCPEVTTLDHFLYCDLSNVVIDKLLRPCTKLTTIIDSINHTLSENSVKQLGYMIDLYDFFNWDDEDIYNKIESLFESTGTAVGFSVMKSISTENFLSIMSKLHKFTKIKKLSNLFSYCMIDNYDSTEIVLAGEMPNVTSINSLFFNCKTSDDTPLRIRRSFFKKLPNVTSMINTFSGVWFDHMLSYDFFCKRVAEENVSLEQAIIEVNGNIPVQSNAQLKTVQYKSLIGNMTNCFRNARFVNCSNWFDPNDEVNEGLLPFNDMIIVGGVERPDIKTYYKRVNGTPLKYEITTPPAYSDTQYNFTNYVESVLIPATNTKINNHNIWGDLTSYNNVENGYPYIENALNIYPTYCCLPPDIFHGCTFECNLDGVFANTNIIGVLPQHLLMKCTSSKINNMFENVNILPNLVYHYNQETESNEDYMKILNGTYEIQVGENTYTLPSIPVDETTISIRTGDDVIVCEFDENAEATVLFRDSNGVLKRRRPISYIHTASDPTPVETPSVINQFKDFNKSQFAYVPQGYASNAELHEAFTFRYNLPNQVNLFATSTWPVGDYDSTYSPEQAPGLWPYYTQYFFTVDESVKWERVTDMEYPFILDGQDKEFVPDVHGDYARRVLYTRQQSDTQEANRWWYEPTESISTSWIQKTEGYLNIFLNLCGQRDVRTGSFTDCGCFISKAKNTGNFTKLDSFVSGILLTFLNGKIFDSGIDGIDLISPIFTESAYIIQYTSGIGRNVIFPRLSAPVSDTIDKKLLYHNPDISKFYQFMFPQSSLQNYKTLYRIADGNIITTSIKYKVIPSTSSNG